LAFEHFSINHTHWNMFNNGSDCSKCRNLLVLSFLIYSKNSKQFLQNVCLLYNDRYYSYVLIIFWTFSTHVQWILKIYTFQHFKILYIILNEDFIYLLSLSVKNKGTVKKTWNFLLSYQILMYYFFEDDTFLFIIAYKLLFCTYCIFDTGIYINICISVYLSYWCC